MRFEGAPAAPSGPTVVGTVAPRKLAVTGPGLAEGQEYYVIMQAASGGAVAVRDPDTGRPLVVTIGPVRKGNAEGWVLGKTPAACDLRGAALSRDLPAPAAGPGNVGAAAHDDT